VYISKKNKNLANYSVSLNVIKCGSFIKRNKNRYEGKRGNCFGEMYIIP
jgi:hypothetical protein